MTKQLINPFESGCTQARLGGFSRRSGRPTTLTNKTTGAVLEFASLQAAADHMGVTTETARRWAREPEAPRSSWNDWRVEQADVGRMVLTVRGGIQDRQFSSYRAVARALGFSIARVVDMARTGRSSNGLTIHEDRV